MATPAQTLNICGVLSETKRIVNAHSRHFLALSVLFLLPLSFSLIIYPTLQSTLFPSDVINSQTRLSYALNCSPDSRYLPLVYIAFMYLLSLCSVATITYSTFHGFYGRPVKLLSAVKSLLYSFLPLLSTSLAAHALLFFVTLVFALLSGAFIKGFEILGFQIDYDSGYFFVLCVLGFIVLGVVLISFQVNWNLASVIVVVESKWGFRPLARSARLLRGMRSVSASLLLFFGCLTAFMVWENSNSVLNTARLDGWRANSKSVLNATRLDGFGRCAFVVQTVVGSAFVMLLLLYSVAANTVLYMYCKALHGELAFEIAEEFAQEYVSLPFDSEKLPHVVTVIQA